MSLSANAPTVISSNHLAELAASAIPEQVALDAGVYTAYTPDQLPDAVAWVGHKPGALPALVYPMTHPDGGATCQVKPAPGSVVSAEGRTLKYVSPGKADNPPKLPVVRAVDNPDVVLIVEGVKQALAALAWAPSDWSIYRITGIWSWSVGGDEPGSGIPTPHLAVVCDRRVVIVPDADAATNPRVYDGAERLGRACQQYGASSVKFVQLPAAGRCGLDDVLAQLPDDATRRSLLKRWVAGASDKPADISNADLRRLRARASLRDLRRTAAAEGDGRPVVVLSGTPDADPGEASLQLTEILCEKRGGTTVFQSGGEIVRLKADDRSSELLAKSTGLAELHRELIDVANPVSIHRDGQVSSLLGTDMLGIVADRLCDELPPLRGIARSPIVREDGTIMCRNGYDPETGLLLDLSPDIEGVEVPEHPTDAELADAVALIRDDLMAVDGAGGFDGWLFPSVADQTHAIASLITPLVRAITGPAPVFLFDGLQPGVGKGGLVNAVHGVAFGCQAAMEIMASREEEVEKRIVARLKAGATSVVLDEVQTLDSPSLRAVTTSEVYAGRELGVSGGGPWDNQATWFALGNNVEVPADMSRRVVPIRLESDAPDPHCRDNFRHDLSAWVPENRRRLLAACLTMVRAWFDQGRPEAPKSFGFASFERWQRVVGGILHLAGIEDFLVTVEEMRRTRDVAAIDTAECWHWIADTFGSQRFSARDVLLKGRADPEAPAPYGVEWSDLTARQLSRIFGRCRQWYDGVRIVEDGYLHGKRKAFRAEVLGGPTAPPPPPPFGGGDDGSGDGDAGPGGGDDTPGSPPVADDSGAPPSAPEPGPRTPGGAAQHEVIEYQDRDPADPTAPVTVQVARAMPPMHGLYIPEVAERVVYLDLETHDADGLWTHGPGFVRLAGYAIGDGPVVTTADIDKVVRVIEDADLVVAHNGIGFDFAALERYHGLDVGRLVRERRLLDTLVVARQNDPPLSGKIDERRYSLDALAQRMGVGQKTGADGTTALKRLATEHGGYGSIPVDDPTYVAYLEQDVEMLRGVAARLVVDDYLWREHEALWRLGHISSVGFRVDTDLVKRTLAEQEVRVQALIQQMHDRYGMPLTGKRPHTSTDGKIAVEAAFRDCGVEPPRTERGSIATGKDALTEVRAEHPDNAPLQELCELLATLNGERTIARTIADCTHDDGRVHPDVGASQATGRLSVTRPGLSVVGKRDRANVTERAFLLPDEGHVLISADLSQIDARAMAMHCQDPGYMEALQPGRDMHSEVAAAIFGVGTWDRTSGERHPRRGDAKPITHATSYGMGARRLAEQTGLSEDEAREQLARLASAYPRLDAFKEYVRGRAQSEQVLVNGHGRRMRVHPGQVYTQAPAAIGQGTARDLMVEGILRLPAWLVPHLRLIIHDEIVLSVPEDRAEEAQQAVLEALEFDHRVTDTATPVPVLAEASVPGRDWADCYRDEVPWPEVARSHREQDRCDDDACTWHRGGGAC